MEFHSKFYYKDWDEFDEMVLHTIKSGSSVVETAYLYDHELKWASDHGTSWYRSKDRRGGVNPHASYMLNKKWTLVEEFNNHMLKFQQVTVISITSIN